MSRTVGHPVFPVGNSPAELGIAFSKREKQTLSRSNHLDGSVTLLMEAVPTLTYERKRRGGRGRTI